VNVEYAFQVHPNRRDQTEVLGRRIDELDDEARLSLLHFLCGYTPAAVQLVVSRYVDGES
jgi:hypothetical protein